MSDTIQLIVVDAAIVEGKLMVQDTQLFTGEYQATCLAAQAYAWERAKGYEPEIGQYDSLRCPLGQWSVEINLV
jgi:hypothetical protein